MPACGQVPSPPSAYYLEGQEVVFVFDVRQYLQELEQDTTGTLDFRDLDIHTVAISGNFNAWSKKGWRMIRRSDFLFELRKPIKAFNDKFPLEFRYLVNGRAAGETQSSSDNRSFADEFLESVYRLDLSVITVSDTGRIRFFLAGYPDAGSVILSGNFNGWDEHAIHMVREPKGWSLRADLPPGRFEYKFIVDGEWMHDPANPDRVKNEHDTYNSVLLVSAPVEFRLVGFPDAGKVFLAGSFNQWAPDALPMTKQGEDWVTTIPLVGGKHLYKYIVDDQWITDPRNPITEEDGKGHLNSVLFVH